jgi:hypothetical protein
MEIVIDSQIVKGYYMESFLASDAGLTADTVSLFMRIGTEDKVFLDSGGHIKAEWKALVDPDWFDAWYPSLLIEGGADEIEVGTYSSTLKALGAIGFPVRSSKDVWYIRTAMAIVGKFGRSALIAEDIHFFEPSKGACRGKARRKILVCRTGSVCRLLSNREKIEVHCIATYLAQCRTSAS